MTPYARHEKEIQLNDAIRKTIETTVQQEVQEAVQSISEATVEVKRRVSDSVERKMKTEVKRAANALDQTEDIHWKFEKFYNDPQNVIVSTKIKDCSSSLPPL